MEHENAFRAISQMSVRVEGARDPGHPSRQIPSARSVSPASARAGYLVMRAMTLFESNRAVAWRCLRDAWTLLGGESAAIGIIAPPLQGVLRPGGLAVWQAKRALEYIEENLGSSPMTYVAARRVERAKIMMTSTRERLTDIALACGFSDQSHLTRSFGRVVGMAPGRWRRASPPP